MKDNDVEIVLSQRTLDESRSKIDFQLRGGPSIEEYQGISRRSQALQSVMNQNEDLMARLKTAMIRSEQLESRLEAKDQEIRKIRKEREDLYEQTLILQEKELIFRERTERSLQKGEDLREENAELLGRLEKVERAFRRLFKYREKVRSQIPQLKVLRKKSHRLTEVNTHLKTQIEELTARLQRIHIEMSESQSKLIADYETQIERLNSELSDTQKKASERDLFLQTKVEFENRCIELTREMAHIKGAYVKESHALKSDLDHYRKQTKELIIQCETLKSQMASKSIQLDEQMENSAKLSDQVESLQILWKEKQEELERSQEKNRSLQKLNQDISLKLNETKREIAQLKQKLEAESELLKRIRQASTPK